MNFRLTAALLGIVAAVVVVLLILSWGDNKEPTGVLTPELVPAGTKPADAAAAVDTVELEKADGSAVVLVRTHKEQNTWEIRKPITAKAEASKIVPIINALTSAKPTTYAELSSDPVVHGLNPAGVKITLRQGQEKSSTVSLGDVTLGDTGVVFVTTSAQPTRPMAVKRSDLDALFRESGKDGKAGDLVKWTSDFRTQRVFPNESGSSGEDVASIKLSTKGKELALSRSASKGWKFDAPDANWGDADTEGDSGMVSPDKFTGVGPLLRALANVSAGGPADFIDQPKDLKEYGLDDGNPDRIRVVMEMKDKQSVEVYFGKFEGGAAPPMPAMPGMPPPPPVGKAYLTVKGVPGVIRANATNLSGLAAIITDPSPLRDRTLLSTSPSKPVDGVDIVLAGQAPDRPTKLRKVGAEWRLYGGPGDPQAANLIAVTRLVDVVSAKRTIKGFPTGPAADIGAISATLYVWVDGFSPPIADKAEPANRGAGPVKLEFGKDEGETVYIRRTLPGQTAASVFTLPTTVKVGRPPEPVDSIEVMKTVAKSRLDLLAPALPTFSDTAPVRVAVNGLNTYTVTKDETPSAGGRQLWRFTVPDARKGQIADEVTLNGMLNTFANGQSSFGKFVSENPANPAEFGLSPPRMSVAVSVGPKGEQTFAYEFGSDSADPDKVYARIVGKPAVFTIQRRIFDQFATPDLRDRVIFRSVPADRVNVVELTGWGGVVLKFEKNKDGVWATMPGSSIPNFVVDPAKLNAFVDLLSKVPVKTFEKALPELKHGFHDPKVSLGAKLSWPAKDKDPAGAVQVNLAASPDNGLTYYGHASVLPPPEQVFTIDAALFKPFKDSQTGFAK